MGSRLRCGFPAIRGSFSRVPIRMRIVCLGVYGEPMIIMGTHANPPGFL